MAARSYFFCGIGGSGMLPLAMYLHARGVEVSGSDRAIDQGRADALKARLAAAGVVVFPQDGSGITSPSQVLVTSSAVEAQIPDVVAAKKMGAEHIIRAQLLAQLTNDAEVSCGIAGTSGKSTTTAMLAHVLSEAGTDPAVVNGAPMLNIRDGEGRPLGWRNGSGAFVCEVDESDGSIARYNPSVGVILNVSEDHKPMAELKELFGGFAQRSGRVVLGIDSEPVAMIAGSLAPEKVVTVSMARGADVSAGPVTSNDDGLIADVTVDGAKVSTLRMPLIGAFNVGNALAAIAAARELGVDPATACEALATFKGSARRLQTVGKSGGVTVIDDFAHNPEKIEGSVGALAKHYARLHVFYQPHGYGPLRSFRELYENAFAGALRQDDVLAVSAPAYFGGTVERTDDAEVMVMTLKDRGCQAHYLPSRDAFVDLARAAKPGDAVVVMGARDDSLTSFAEGLLAEIAQR
ncbi:Mur ligase family protein [Parvularcula lutaonensis]|uniref:Mur ligase family protein n=1 Tax=Parvularcula lutaonensis TaxID=491923 RepID=A0ABV7M9X1_9PROT|nr:Mur ligase family protein [Parvularcula lutaonensis]GGY47741.1 UDP-N-acetylmuramate--L-alanine ligase [Parvularcula lutaonensis]